MKVILKKRIPKLGQEWDIVTVKDGYARNYLLPQNLADIATPNMLKIAEQKKEERLKKMEEVMESAKEIVEKLSGVSLTFAKKAKEGKLYGSIAEKDIIASLKKEQKIEISKEMVKMPEHIKTIGEHKVLIHFAEGVEVEIRVKVEEEKK